MKSIITVFIAVLMLPSLAFANELSNIEPCDDFGIGPGEGCGPDDDDDDGGGPVITEATFCCVRTTGISHDRTTYDGCESKPLFGSCSDGRSLQVGATDYVFDTLLKTLTVIHK
ncbi:MAG: hypothetical protein AAGB12_13605 [Pseudomonadota bacterium]